MSRIGKQLITIPPGVNVELDGDVLIVKGPKGELQQKIHPFVKVTLGENTISLNIADEKDKFNRSLWGLFGSLISNLIEGVTKGYEKKLEINGVGMKAAVSGKKIILNVGFSHPVDYNIPEGINISVAENVITIAGIDKQLVGETAAQIRRIKKVEPYKGKGIKYVGEQFVRKAGKAAAKTK